VKLPAVIDSPLAARSLAGVTEARIGLGRAGSSLTTRDHLAFVGDHARARDAVWTAAGFDALADGIAALGPAVLRVLSRAEDRATYLRRPDLGRLLDDASTSLLAQAALSPQGRVAVVVADGLSAEAVDTNALPVLRELLRLLEPEGLAPASVVLAAQGRVAIADPVAEALGASIVAVLVGERPGLSAADSLGCYVTWNPRPGTPDSRRNCVSNIRAGGLAPAAAAARIAWLVREGLSRRLTGVELKAPDELPRLEG
jgi:ethanolamine ammonia-lyase small subunit